MNEDNDYYRTLDLRRLAESIPHDKASRSRSESFQEVLIALVLRSQTDSVTSAELLDLLGEPDLIEETDKSVVWEYCWRGEHCLSEYRSSTPFIIRDGRVIGVRRTELSPAS